MLNKFGGEKPDVNQRAVVAHITFLLATFTEIYAEGGTLLYDGLGLN